MSILEVLKMVAAEERRESVSYRRAAPGRSATLQLTALCL